MVVVGCGSSDDGGKASEGSSSSSSKPVEIQGVPGVTDTEIRYAAVGTNSNNPLGNCYLKCFLDGVSAYFDYRNSQGGIYGRKLVVTDPVDDQLGKNLDASLAATSADDGFGVFDVPVIGSGYAEFAKRNWPVYSYITDHALAAKPNIFGSYAIACIADCPRVDYPFVAKAVEAKRIASLGYGIAPSSKACAAQVARSFEEYADATGGAKVVYKNDALDFGFPNGVGPEVSAMKAAGVQLVFQCLDQNGSATVAREMKRQGLDVPMVSYQGYDESLYAKTPDIYEGDIVGTHLRPLVSASSSGMALYERWMKKSGADMTELSVHGWIAADIAYEGLKRAGSSFDRAKVIAATNEMKGYTAGRLVTPRDFGRQHTAPTADDRATHGEIPYCISYLVVHDGKFQFLKPESKDKPFLCWSGNDYTYTDPTARDL
jgi:ABC-type branched-subunit amino acid transport system substrate-binding protein